MDKLTAIFLAEGCEEVEALTTVDLLRRAKVPVTMVAIGTTREVTGSHGIRITADTTISEIHFDDYDMLILPGGIPGTPNLAACKPLTDALLDFAAKGKEIAAICAAPSILADLGILRGRTAACNPSKEDVEGGRPACGRCKPRAGPRRAGQQHHHFPGHGDRRSLRPSDRRALPRKGGRRGAAEQHSVYWGGLKCRT
jgi:DJ-1 family protein